MALLQNPEILYCGSPTRSSSNTSQHFSLITETSDAIQSAGPLQKRFLLWQLEQYSLVQNIRSQHPKSLIRFCASFFVKESTRYKNLSFTLERMFQQVPEHWFPKNFTDVPGFISYSLEHMCLTKVFIMLLPHLL